MDSGARSFCSTRPPMVVFLLCLASFALTTFSLSVYVAQSDKIRNPDVLDWNTLLFKLTKLDFCLPFEQSVYNLTNLSDIEQSDWISSTLTVQVSKDFAEAFYDAASKVPKRVLAKGQVLVQHLGRRAPAEFLDDNLIIGFELPPQIQGQQQDDDVYVCLEVRGPKGLIQYLEVNDTSCSSPDQGEFAFLPLMSHSQNHIPAYWCERNPLDKKVNLAFEMDYNAGLTMYVSAKDKELIHLHLMVTSVFLFAILAIVIIAFLVRTVTSSRKQIDSRGDHHLIMMNRLNEDA